MKNSAIITKFTLSNQAILTFFKQTFIQKLRSFCFNTGYAKAAANQRQKCFHSRSTSILCINFTQLVENVVTSQCTF